VSNQQIHICIDARLEPGVVGGVQQAVIGLASGLSTLTDSQDEAYLFVTQADASWLSPYVSGNCRIVPEPRPPAAMSFKARVRSRMGTTVRLWRTLSPLLGRLTYRVPAQDPVIENLAPHIIHFPTQRAFLTDVTSIYHPWDLQHYYFPEFFSPRELMVRQLTYAAYCQQAAMVVAATSWAKRDFISHLNVAEEKIRVIPAASILSSYTQITPQQCAEISARLRLPSGFLYYPAHTFTHKNHIGLLHSLAALRDQGLVVSVVCSGGATEFFPHIDKAIRTLNLQTQVRFLGMVDPADVRCLYQRCRGLVFPSKFEGWGLPITEAWATGVPVACSNVTSLPDLAGDAALLFNPDSIDNMADAIRRLWQDDTLRRTLVERGSRRAQLFSWKRTARIFRAHYRRLAGRSPT
jgi:glycosyltransferase involved in cell wall biosynthesis